MFLNTIKFNKNIKWRIYKNLFFNFQKKNLYFYSYNSVDIKALKNFFYIKEDFKLKTVFYKNLKFNKKSNHHLWWYYKNYKNFNLQFIPNSHYLLKIQTVFNQNFKKILYNSSKGNFVFFWYTNFPKSRNIFKYPSKKKLILPFLIFSFFNRKEGFFKRKNIFRFFKFKRNKSVRGIAQNPNDHHNGGRSNTKKPFFNKYYKIAKKGK